MPICGSCEFFGKKGSVEWCFHQYKNYTTSYNNSSCEYYRPKW